MFPFIFTMNRQSRGFRGYLYENAVAALEQVFFVGQSIDIFT